MNIIAPPLALVTAVVGFVAALLARLLTERRVSLGASALTGLLAGLAVGAWQRPRGRLGLTVPRRVLSRASPTRTFWPATMRPGAMPTFEQLSRVVPVAQTATHEGAALTVLSIEVYRDGFLVHSRMPAAPRGAQEPGMMVHPQLVIAAHDDRGGRYDGWPSSGSGNDRAWRFSHAFGPALDAQARHLTLEVREIVWERFGPEGRETGWTQPGPWRYEIALD